MTRSRYAPWLAAALLVACGTSREVEAKQSAGRISRAIEQLRNAPNDTKATALAALAKLPCVGADVCETRAACQAAYAEHVEALSLTAAAKLLLSQGKSLDAAKLVGSAQQKLSDAAGKVTTCTERQGALRRRYALD